MNQPFVINNRKNLLAKLADKSVAILFAGAAPSKTADQIYEFTPNRNFYYLTGIDKPSIALVITKFGEHVSETIYIEKADPVLEKWEGKKLNAEQATAASGVHNIDYIDDLNKAIDRELLRHDYKHLYLDFERRGWDGVATPAHQFAKSVQEKYPFLSIENLYHEITRLRMIKSEEEVAKLRKAIEITDKGIQNMMNHARPGIMEYELEAHFDFILKSNNVKHHAFHSIIASGANATVLHYEDNDMQAQDNELVLIDLGAQYQHYNADISRTFPVNGTFTDRQKVLYNIVLKAELETIKAIKPGLPFSELNAITKRVLAEECKQIGLITTDEEINELYYHNVSHYLGLDTHDPGNYRDELLQPGMVITVEPGLYVAAESIGIRIEDDVLVTETGYEVLSKDIIKTVDEIEAFMAGAKQKQA
ncbi:MAG: aminopeptidase P N-terminal domain-containing protein [Tumebacillaceae bacterium]